MFPRWSRRPRNPRRDGGRRRRSAAWAPSGNWRPAPSSPRWRRTGPPPPRDASAAPAPRAPGGPPRRLRTPRESSTLWPLSVEERNLDRDPRRREVGWQCQEAAGHDRVRGRLVERGVAGRLQQTHVRDAPVPLDRELQIDVPPNAEEHGLRHEPVPVDLVLEMVDPDREVRAFRIEEERPHLLARARHGPARPGLGQATVEITERAGQRRGTRRPAGCGDRGRLRTTDAWGEPKPSPSPAPVRDQAGRRSNRSRRWRRLGPLRAIAARRPPGSGRQVIFAPEEHRPLGPVG